MKAHICNKDIVLLTYPAQYKCSVCGSVDNTDFVKKVGIENFTQLPMTTLNTDELLELEKHND